MNEFLYSESMLLGGENSLYALTAGLGHGHFEVLWVFIAECSHTLMLSPYVTTVVE